MIFRFDGAEEEKRALGWMRARLLEVRNPSADGQDQAIREVLAEIDVRLKQLEPDCSPRTSEVNERIWERFLYGVSGVQPDDVPEEQETPEPVFEWGEWDLSGARDIKLGYSQFLLKTSVPTGGGSPAHYYSRVPPRIHWTLTPIRQKAVAFFIGKAQVSEIDAVCSVPQLPHEIGSAESGRRVLDRKLGDEEWQRRIDAKRVLAIRNFISDRSNIVANSAIIFASDSPAFSSDSQGQISIDLGGFLRREKGVFTDRLGRRDLRPLWLIDGQHRVRGLAQSKEGIDLELPIILFPPDFSLPQSAKIFAEINTLQKKLTPLHTLFMQHRFGIPSPDVKRDFRRPWSAGDQNTWNSRANHLSYECAAYLTSHEGGPLYDRIRILDQNAPRYTIIQASQWVDFSRRWFSYGRIYTPERDEPQKTINAEVENFFSAFVSICNHDGWGDGMPRWTDSTSNKGLLQRQGPSQALLLLYPTAWELARQGGSQSPITEKRFADVLRPLTWVDWLDPDLRATYARSGERARGALRIWMETAIRHGKVYPHDEVMSKEIHSQPGSGILSSPARGLPLEILSPSLWPTQSDPIVIRATQPANTLPGSIWAVFDTEGVNRTPQDAFVLAEEGFADLELAHDFWMDLVPSFDVRVDWYNAVDPPGGTVLRVRRP